MKQSLLHRLRRMTHEEVSWRARSAARNAADRIAVRLRQRRWNRADIGGARAGAPTHHRAPR
jgi:hypothetical protein